MSDQVMSDQVMSDQIMSVQVIPASVTDITPLGYNDSVDTTTIENVLLMHSDTEELNTYTNSNTFGIVYNTGSSRDELLSLLRSKFSNSNIKRIGIAFHYIDSEVFFLDNEKLFTMDDLDATTTTYSNNLQFMLDIINELNITHLDYLACNTLENENYKKYYDILTNKTNVIVGASEDKTGNIKYGGDWVLENTQDDIQNVYFTNEIVNYANVLAVTTYSFINVNYQYDPALSSTTASVVSSPSASGSLAILSHFVLNGGKGSNITYTVTSLSTSAFYGCTGLTSIIMPSSVTSIGSQAFQGCTGLTSITIPFSVNSIGSQTFYNCIGLTSITIPASVTSIGQYAFYGCTGLTSITIPSSVTSIGSNIFNGCTGLTSITIPTSVNSIGSQTFYNCIGLTSITIPTSVTSIGEYAFYGCTGLTSITIPSSVTSIDRATFQGCTGLTSFTIPSTVTSIGQYAFNGCTGLTSITIPSNVTSIGQYAFQGCTGLTSIYIPSSVTSIATNAFQGCTGLTSVYTNKITSNVYSNRETIFGSLITANSVSFITCFKKDTKILTDKGYIAIQDLRKGDLVKTIKHDFKPIEMIGKREIYHPALQERIKHQLYKCSKNEYPEVFEDLIVTGCHCILVDNFVDEEQREKTIKLLSKIYVTDNKYRLPACLDDRSSVYEIPSTYTIYHLALENENYYENYGIYANGLLVETCSKRYLKELSNMTLIE